MGYDDSHLVLEWWRVSLLTSGRKVPKLARSSKQSYDVANMVGRTLARSRYGHFKGYQWCHASLLFDYFPANCSFTNINTEAITRNLVYKPNKT